MSGAGYIAELASQSRAHRLWVEIAGLPVGYGIDSRASGLNATSVVPWLARDSIPDSITESLDDAEARVVVSSLALSIVDQDGSVAALLGTRRSDGWVRLTSAKVPSDTGTFDVSGDTSSFASGGGVAYIGQETIGYAGKTSTSLTGVTRGLYGSPRLAHEGASVGFDGAVVSSYPRMMEGRRVRLVGEVNSDGTDALRAAVLWQGGLESMSFDAALRRWQLGCAAGYAGLRRSIYWRLNQWGATDREVRRVRGAVAPLVPDATGTTLIVANGAGAAAWRMSLTSAPPATLTRARRVEFLAAGFAVFYTPAAGLQRVAGTVVSAQARQWGPTPGGAANAHGGWLTAPIEGQGVSLGGGGFTPAATDGEDSVERLNADRSQDLNARIRDGIREVRTIGDAEIDRFGTAPLVWLPQTTVVASGSTTTVLVVRSELPVPIGSLVRVEAQVRRVTATGVGTITLDTALSGVPTDAASVDTASAHPLAWCLAHLQSGAALGTGATEGKYAVLDADCGLALTNTEIDVAGFEALARSTPDLTVHGIVSDVIEDAGTWLRDAFLRPFGFFLRTDLDGKMTVGVIREASPDTVEDAVAIADAEILRDGIGAWVTDGSDVVGAVRVEDDFWTSPADAAQASYRDTLAPLRADDGGLVVERYPRAQTVEIRSLLTGGSRGTVDIASRIASRIGSRRGDATARLTIDVGLRRLSLHVGSLVSLTLARVPDQQTGERGVEDSLWEVVSRTVDLRGARLRLSLRQSAFGSARTRYYAPTARVVATPGAGVLTLETRRYADGGTDAGVFAANMRVRAYSAAFGTRSTVRTVSSVATNSVTLSDASSISAGDILTLADYADGTAAQADDATAYRAARAGTLTSSTPATIAAHEHG